MNAQAIVDQLFTDSSTYQRDAMQAAAANWPAVGPVLIARILAEVEVLRASDAAELDHYGCAYALALFGYTCDPAAWPALLALCRLPDETADQCIGSNACEDLGQILYRTCAARFHDVVDLFNSAEVNQWVRGAALKTMQYATAEGFWHRKDLLAMMLVYLEGLGEVEDEELAWSVGNELLKMRPHEFAPRVKALAEIGALPDDEFEEERDELLRDDPEKWAEWIASFERDLDHYEPGDLHDRICWSNCFEEMGWLASAVSAPLPVAKAGGRKSKASPDVKQRKHKKQIANKAKRANRKRK